jgi:hypothetical protein
MSGLKYPLAHLPMLGKGSILIDRLDASGNPTGFMPIGNATKFELDLKDDRAELYSSMNKTVTLIATALKKRQPTLSITGTDFRDDVATLFLMSDAKTLVSTTASSISAEPLAGASVTKKGKYFETVHRNLDPTPANIVVNQASSALVAGTDYIVADPVEGLIYFPASGAVDDTAAVTIDYKTLVGSFSQIAGGTVPVQQARLRFVPDPTDGQKIGVEVWRVNLSPNGQIGFIADDYGNWTLDGFILDDAVNHPNAPYYLATFY